MDRVQFEHILQNASRVAVVLIGVVAFAVAMALGKFILAPISLAIVVGLMFGPVADAMERRGVPSALSAGVVVLLFLGLIGAAGMLFAAPISEWVARWPMLWSRASGSSARQWCARDAAMSCLRSTGGCSMPCGAACRTAPASRWVSTG